MFEGEAWWEYLDEGQKDLVKQAYTLLEKFKVADEKFQDYSFVVFPIAKAYEGFLKKWFWEMGLIDRQTYMGDRFRIGKALNPDLPKEHRGDWWMYGLVAEKCGEEVAQELWQAWKQARNRLFHFFPPQQSITLEESHAKLEQLRRAMTEVMECKKVTRNKRQETNDKNRK